MTNSFEKFPIGSGKHAIFCGPNGNIIDDGVLVRLGEDEFEGFCLSPYLEFYQAQGNYDVTIEQGDNCVYQLCGPTSLDVVQAATGEDLIDIKFFHRRPSKIAGMDVNILRIGMAGSLGYEVHGHICESLPVYEKLMEVGEQYGIRELGIVAYDMTHWEGGFPQGFLEFLPDGHRYEELVQFPPYSMLQTLRMGDGSGPIGYGNAVFDGSAAEHPELLFRAPYDNNWEKAVRFDYDFVGREALEKIAQNPPRRMTTLEWNVDDIMDIHRSQYTDEPYKDISYPDDMFTHRKGYHLDYVLHDGKQVAVTSGRMYSWHYKKMISLCSLPAELAVEGTEVAIPWGDPGTRQKEVRAKVTRYPMVDERNEDIDVTKR